MKRYCISFYISIMSIICMLMMMTLGRMTTTELGWLNDVLFIPMIYSLFAIPVSINGIIIAVISSTFGIKNSYEPKLVLILNSIAVIVHIIFMGYWVYLMSIQ